MDALQASGELRGLITEAGITYPEVWSMTFGKMWPLTQGHPVLPRSGAIKLLGAKAADNVGCEPPQIPSIQAQSLQQLRRCDSADTI
jgi:hypothetical protein